MRKSKLTLKENAGDIELKIGERNMSLEFLKDIRLEMNADEGNKLHLTYHVSDVEVDTEVEDIIFTMDEE